MFGGLTPAGLTQVSGETATGSQQTTFNAMNQFMGVMTDPFVAGRGDPISAGGNPNAYADEQHWPMRAKRKPNDALAAIYTKAPPVRRHSSSAGACGRRALADRRPRAAIPRARLEQHAQQHLRHGAVGADYRFSPNTLAGFALAGGGTNFSVNGFGTRALRPVPGRCLHPAQCRRRPISPARWPMAGRTSPPIAP